ncbi:MAG: hypothetical protein L6Q66_12095, partial [Bacteroidia bacterium]|nr:hypothetical protein [Bacteroidia bacterium]
TLNNSTIQNPVATPTATTTYTVTITDSRGCTTTATTTVTVVPAQCAVTLNRDIASGTFLSSLWPANTMVSGQNIRITGTVYADVNITFANCNIIMQPNAKIQLQNSTIFKLTEKTHVYSCTDMWDGIYSSSPTQKIIVEQNAFVEDGLNAIVSENGGQYDISTSIFNKNLIAIDIRTFNNNSGTNYPGVIRKNVFTSRAIPSNAVPSSNAGMATVLSNINSYPAANTKAPYPIQKGAYGVNITDVNGSFGVNIGFGGLMPDGTSAVNTFEGIMVGVNVVRSTVKIYNNSFVNLLNPNLCIGCYNVKGYGVKATGTSTGNYSIVVGFSGQYNNNTFNNCYRAVETYEYKNVDIGYNIINNSITASGSTPGYGNGGILVMKPASASSINVLQNNINNCSFAIWLGFAYSSYTIDTYSMQVNGNTISANSNGYCTNGVYINALSSATINTPATSEIMDNIITEATNGISISNFKKIINIKENSITTRYASTGNTNGIKLVGCQNLVVENNHTKYNNVGGLAYNIGSNLSSYGIYLQNSTNMLIKCNEIDDAARSMVFEGTCTSSPYLSGYGIFQNTMSRAQDGFVLLNNGVIGQQGAQSGFFSYASNNYWDNTTTPTFTRSQTYTDNSPNANTTSRLFMNNTALTFPTNNQTTTPGNEYMSGVGLGLNISTAIPTACGRVPAMAP